MHFFVSRAGGENSGDTHFEVYGGGHFCESTSACIHSRISTSRRFVIHPAAIWKIFTHPKILRFTEKKPIIFSIWMFPKKVAPPNHPLKNRVCPLYSLPYFWIHPYFLLLEPH